MDSSESPPSMNMISTTKNHHHHNHSRQLSQNQNQLNFPLSSDNHSSNTTSSVMNHHNGHSRHHSLNVNLSQLTIKTMSNLHNDPFVQCCCSASTSSNCINHQQNEHMFRHYHYHLDNNIQLTSSKSWTNRKRHGSINSISMTNNIDTTSTISSGSNKWTLLVPELMAISICNFNGEKTSSKNHNTETTSSSKLNRHNHQKSYLKLCIGDVVVIVERYGHEWYHGYHENDPQKLGIIPANYVQVFDDHRKFRLSRKKEDGSNEMIFYYYTLLDPLYLQMVRTLREWHHLLVSNYYRTNVSMEKFLIVRNLIYELLELSSSLNKDLAPSLWRRRSNQLLKINSDPKDPFAKLYLGEDDDNDNNTNEGHNDDSQKPEHLFELKNGCGTSTLMFDSSLEDLYDRILTKLNQGNQHLSLDIMPSFTHGTFNNLYQQQKSDSTLSWSSRFIFNNLMNPEIPLKKRNKFSPYYTTKEQCKYLPYILDYYNQINRGFNQKFKSNISSSSTITNPPALTNHRHSFSSFVTNHHKNNPSANAAATSSSGSSGSLIRKFRRHLLFLIREASFSNLFSSFSSDTDQLQIDVYIIRCNHSDSSGSSDSVPYEVLTEKYCYRVQNCQNLQQQSFNNKNNVNRALFLDVLSKRSPQNGLSVTNHFQSSQHSDASNYYLIIQVWRYGRMLVNDSGSRSAAKTMLSATSSLTTGSSVFHTISTSSISSAAVAAVTSNSLSSLTSFVSNSFNNNNSSTTEKSTSSGTLDSSSIDSSTDSGFGTTSHFKRSVGFSVIPLLELVSRDKEIRPSPELFQNESFISKILFSDEQMLLPLSVKLYEGDFTVSVLETMLKHRQSLTSTLSNHHQSSQSSASISKLSPLAANQYQLVVCAKFISELMLNQQNNQPINSGSKRSSNGFAVTTDNCNLVSPTLSLADYLLLSQNQSFSTLVNDSGDFFPGNFKNFVLVQKRCFGDLITAGYFRNDFYLTLESAEFEKGGKTIPKNIEVSVCLITENGMQERAISSGVNNEPVTIYRSHIQYHQNSPKWFEHLKVNVPLEQFEMAHLRFVFCHCSSKERERKFLGFSFLPLADQHGACLPDGEHELYIYKCDSERKLDDVRFYLNVPWGQYEKISSLTAGNSQSSISLNSNSSNSSLSSTSSLINSRSSKETFHVKTILISSKLTQNSDILALLKWNSTPLDQVYDSLQRLSRVPGEEMVKFLEDILDALFALFTASTSNSRELNSNITQQSTMTSTTNSQTTLIFRVLVDFFKTLNDPKFVSYRSALEKYIEKQFSAPLVYSGLISCVKKYIELVIVSVQQINSEQATVGSSISSNGVTKRELEFILRCLSVFDWILKMIVQSRILYTRASISGNLILESSTIVDNKPIEIQTDEEFKDELLSLFSFINQLLSVECKSSDDYLIVAIQESVLNSLPNAFTFLSQILRPLEIAKLVQSLVHLNHINNANNRLLNSDCFSPTPSTTSITPTNSTPTTTSCSTTKKKTIINAKLSLLQQAIQCPYIWTLDEEARLELLDTYIRMLNICMSESQHCLHILRDVILYLIENAQFDCCKVRRKRMSLIHPNEREIEMLSFGAIDSIVEHIIELIGVVPTSFDHLFVGPFNTTAAFKLNTHSVHSDEGDYLGTLIICFMVLLDFMTLKHYEKLFEKRSISQCKELILNIFAVFLNALYYFPDNWLEVKMAVNRIMLHSLMMLRTIMSQKFLAPERFDETIWRMYFKLAIAFLTQPRLQLEQSPNYWKRRFILDVYGCDMRIMMGFELIACWDLIGPSKISFIPSLVASFVDVTLVPELELRQATIPIFYDMLMVDYISNCNFKQVEAALVDKLDVVAHKSECDFQFKELFTQILTEKIESNKPVWNQEGLKLVQSISRLLSLLIDYRNELKRKLNVVASSSSPIIIKPHQTYGGDQVYDDRLLICTYTLLRFFRDNIESTNRKTIMLRYLEKLANVHTLLGNYAEAAFTLKLQADQLSWSSNESQKKESLCQTMLNYFEKGQCWEEGIKVCKDLQQVYEHSYKYRKLSAILKRNADLLDKILTQHRPDNEYFRISFYGLDFPSFLQNSTFIFRGLEFEKISSFTHRIQQEFPNAQLLTKIIPTDENITESKCQYIQIFSVKPIPEPPVFPDQTLLFGTPDQQVIQYYNTNSVKQFSQDRPIQRAPFDPNNEFKSLWIERTIYTTEQSLPGMLRMFKVVSTLVTYLSPIENACETIENKNMELSKLISTYSQEANKPESIAPLSMRLQGILDAAVNGGIAKYIDAFLGSEFLTANPDQVANVSRLKDRIANQIQLVETGLTLHGRLAPTLVRPLHTRLLERFATMRTTVHQANIETSQALLWIPSSNSIIHRPSILSQPLPPIPQRQDTLSISDPSSDTSSLSSTSSSTQTTANILNNHDRMSLRTPPPSQPPPPPPYAQSPGGSGRSLKNKPLPPLPPTTTEHKHHSGTLVVKRHHSNIEHRSKPTSIKAEDTIYSVPQYTDLDLCNLLPDNESSVDDSMDYCDVQLVEPSFSIETMDGNGSVPTINSRINRSYSIHACSTATSLYNSGVMGHSNQNLIDFVVDNNSISPPPLPPRTSGTTLDRSNSLNSGVMTRPIGPPLVTAIIPSPPPALPQRPIKKSSSNHSQQHTNGLIMAKQQQSLDLGPLERPPLPPLPNSSSSLSTSHFAALDGLEFENLLLSSPTPLSSTSHQQISSRPTPIIGIEINNNNENNNHNENDNLINVADSLSNFVSVSEISSTTIVPSTTPLEQVRTKSNSLPRSLQQQFTDLMLNENPTKQGSSKMDNTTSATTIPNSNNNAVKNIEPNTLDLISSLID